MLQHRKINKMILIWFTLIITGTCLTIWGTYELSKELNKNDLLKQQHSIPDFMLIDFEVESQINATLTNQILTEIKPKYYVEGETFENQKEIDLIGFFDEKKFKEKPQFKKNYELSNNIYEEIRNLKLTATSTSKDSSVIIKLTKNSNEIIFTKYDQNLKDSYIEVLDYNRKTNQFNIRYHNIQLNVENKRLSKFITDLDNGKLNLNLITKTNIKELKNIKLKTKSTEYFQASEIVTSEFGYNAKLNLILR